MSTNTGDEVTIKKGVNYFWGILCVVFGGLLLCDTIFGINLFTMGNWWPMFVIAPGICLELVYYSLKRFPGLLIPGGILTTIGLLFFFEVATGWRFAEYTWPVYILAVCVGLSQFYLRIGKPRGLLVVLSLLFVIAITSFGVLLLGAYTRAARRGLLVPVALVVVGLLFLLNGVRRKK